jgi:holo-[acyl-carrier protein] synthase
MILGIGTDLCRIERMRRAVVSPAFRDKVFDPEEIVYATARGDPARHFASAFAAKEAFAKATGWGLFRTGPRNVWVERTGDRPELRWRETLRDRLPEGTRAHLSLSHEGEYAIAFVVLEVRP